MKFTHYSCPLKSEININGKKLQSREWIEISSGSKVVDLCPLPGLHPETLEESFEAYKSGDKSLSSSRFAIEYLSSNLKIGETSKVNKLTFIDLDLDAKEVFKSFTDGEVIKVKIGRNNIENEISWLKSIENRDLLLRLDGNLNLSLVELNRYIEEIPNHQIDYFEEPLKNFEDYKKLDLKNVSIALDENISKRNELLGVSNLVIKPTYNLGLNETLKLIQEEKFNITISSSFDSPNNLKILHQLGYHSNNHAGLDTIKFFDTSRLKSSPF